MRFYVDDGDVLDLRVAQILDRWQHKGIFYISPMNPKINPMSPSDIRTLSERHEIGGHTLTHPTLSDKPKFLQIREIDDGKLHLEEIIEKPITKFAYPKGWYNQEVIDSVNECGFLEARTMHQGATTLSIIEGNFEIPVSVHFYPGKFEKWREQYELAKRADTEGRDGYFGVTCHGWELEKFHLWGEYENMLKQIYEDQVA